MQESKTGARRMGRDMRASLASFSSESNQLFCYIFVSAEVCINIAVTVKFNGVIMSWPGVHGVRRRDDGKPYCISPLCTSAGSLSFSDAQGDAEN